MIAERQDKQDSEHPSRTCFLKRLLKDVHYPAYPAAPRSCLSCFSLNLVNPVLHESLKQFISGGGGCHGGF